VRFGRWDDVLAMAEPPSERPHARAIWHYGRGRAWIAEGNPTAADAELGQLRRIAERPELAELKMEFNYSDDLVRIAERVLTGRLEAAQGRYGRAVEALREAVRGEDALTYGEPPEWSVPTRLDLGEVLLEAEDYVEAERIFRESLVQFPRNGWALRGLGSALRAQGREREAAVVEADLRSIWAAQSHGHH
jgi:tetratricopeptide (TPR) repeat protein